MKKLLFILSAILVSAMGWAQNNSTSGLEYTLNPYAYDLSIKSWDPASRKLTVHFRLNSPPNLDDNGTDNTGPYNTGISDREPNGIQIYAVDQQGNEYRIGGLGRDVIQKGIRDGYFDYLIDLSAGTTVEFNGGTPKPLPIDEVLTWKVRVKGRSNQYHNDYKIPRHVTARPADFKRPRYVLGVSIGKNPLSPNFGKMFTTELEDGSSSSSTSSTWYWLYNALYDANYKESHRRMPAVLEFTPQLKFKGVHKKYIDDGASNSHFSLQKYSEPHRVKVSEDGRIFVSSYHQGAGAAVKEYLGNNTFRTVIKFNASINNDNQGSTEYPTNSKYNRRAVDFDVKGSGDDLNILVAWVKPKGSPATGNNKQWNTSIEIYEYKVGKEYDIDQTNGGTLVARYIESNPSNHLCGYLFQSYYATGYCAQRALIGVGYGSGNNDIWLKVDPGVNFDTSLKQARIMYFNKQKGLAPQKVSELAVGERYEVVAWDGMPAGEFYGGGAFVVRGNKLYTYAAMSATGSPGSLRIYTINNDGSLSKERDIALNVSAPWANGFTIDYANNLYMVSEWLGDIKTIALPYDGVIETPSTDNFTVPHFASNLAYAPTEGKNSYNFSFNVDVEPQTVQIRLYDSKDKMLAGGEDYTYYIPCTTVNKGSNSVEIGAVRGQANGKEITNQALPAGEYYWAISVTGQGGRTDVTPSSDNYCYIPERLSHDMNDTEMNLASKQPNGLDLYRPFQGGMFNTICLPFKLDLTTLPANHPLKDATLKEYTGLNLVDGLSGEKVLELTFADVDGGIIRANTPYLIQPKENYNSIIRFATPTLTNTTGGTVYHEDETNTYGISYQGIIPLLPTVVDGESLTLILVADNRLAVLTGAGDMYGFRGYFRLNQPLPRGMQTRITTSKGTTTNTTIVVDGKKVNVNKFLREGRVYIRMGDSLYTVDGQLVK